MKKNTLKITKQLFTYINFVPAGRYYAVNDNTKK